MERVRLLEEMPAGEASGLGLEEMAFLQAERSRRELQEEVTCKQEPRSGREHGAGDGSRDSMGAGAGSAGQLMLAPGSEGLSQGAIGSHGKVLGGGGPDSQKMAKVKAVWMGELGSLSSEGRPRRAGMAQRGALCR